MKNAIRTTTAIFGALAGLAGIEHGVGEILQGSTAPESIFIQSWPHSAAFAVVSGEPALTVLPNLRITGILAVTLSLIFMIWAVFFVQRRHGGRMLMLLCIPMLLLGAGFGPPLLGLITGAAAARAQAAANARAVTGPRNAPSALRRLLSRLWPWFLGACLAAWLAMMPGTMLMKTWWNYESEALVLGLIVAMFSLLFLALGSAAARDNLDAQSTL